IVVARQPNFLRPERIGQASARRTRRQRLLLGLVRRPAGQPDDFECCPDAAVGIGETLAIDLHHTHQRRASERPPATLTQGVCRTHATQVMHQGNWRCVARRDPIYVGHWQSKTRALKQCARLAEVWKWNDAWRYPLLDLGFRSRKGLAQLG